LLPGKRLFTLISILIVASIGFRTKFYSGPGKEQAKNSFGKKFYADRRLDWLWLDSQDAKLQIKEYPDASEEKSRSADGSLNPSYQTFLRDDPSAYKI
jgi:hypothetical protein